MQKKYLITFYLALKGTEGVLSLQESRIRDKFLKWLTEETSTFELNRNEIFKTYGKLKEGEDNVYEFSPENAPKVNKELETLMAETVSLPETAGIKEILEQTQYKPKSGEAELIDEIISQL